MYHIFYPKHDQIITLHICCIISKCWYTAITNASCQKLKVLFHHTSQIQAMLALEIRSDSFGYALHEKHTPT